ncbi:MAG: phosphoribosylformylglycinamidine synthase subunit PurS [Bacteroidetes bacterium]|nr:phosphoribosylformylglycinamidine synthase subunit PurS [Bacteroidota bacterium]MSP58073.1 phosphoribosylformylglycinamidine synthase, purS protein [Flavobacteriaceae bacterium]PHX92196.1 MAG: phosphoribosylformylglycinamidine synthase, purS protein [Flavobacteriales bacterium]
MKFNAEIEILPLKGLLDPQGKAVANGLPKIGIHSASNVRIGKFITLDIEATSADEARVFCETACTKLLANLIMEGYAIRIKAT